MLFFTTVILSYLLVSEQQTICPKIYEPTLSKKDKAVTDVAIIKAYYNNKSFQHEVLEPFGLNFSICVDSEVWADPEFDKIVSEIVILDEAVVFTKVREVIIYYPLSKIVKRVCPFSNYLLYKIKCPPRPNYTNEVFYEGINSCQFVFYQYEKHACAVTATTDYYPTHFENADLVYGNRVHVIFIAILCVSFLTFIVTILIMITHFSPWIYYEIKHIFKLMSNKEYYENLKSIAQEQYKKILNEIKYETDQYDSQFGKYENDIKKLPNELAEMKESKKEELKNKKLDLKQIMNRLDEFTKYDESKNEINGNNKNQVDVDDEESLGSDSEMKSKKVGSDDFTFSEMEKKRIKYEEEIKELESELKNIIELIEKKPKRDAEIEKINAKYKKNLDEAKSELDKYKQLLADEYEDITKTKKANEEVDPTKSTFSAENQVNPESTLD